MRIGVLAAFAGLLVAGAATPSVAQSVAEPTVEDYLCIFAGKCDGNEGQAQASSAPSAEGVTEGFRIARPAAAPEKPLTSTTPSKSTSSTRKPAAKKPAAKLQSKPNLVQSPSPATSAVGLSSAPLPSAPRVDLRIGFELNSSRLTPDGENKARVFAQSLLTPELSGKRFMIEGHTDSLGPITLNMNLSRERAQAVADFLSQQGVDRSRMQVQGFGPGIPLPGLPTTDVRNRRVEARLIS